MKGVIKMKMKEFMDKVNKFVDENAPTILAVIAGVGVLGTAVMAASDTFKAQKVLEEKKPETVKEKVKATWSCYIPTAATAGMTIFAIGMSNHISKARIAALTGALALNANSFKEYKAKVEELLGKKEATKVQDAVAQDKVLAKRPQDIGAQPIGMIRCMDSITGQEFWSSISELARIESDINRTLYSDQWYSFADVLWAFGKSNAVIGQYIGWNVGDGPIQFNYTSCLNENDFPVLVINYSVMPSSLSFDR